MRRRRAAAAAVDYDTAQRELALLHAFAMHPTIHDGDGNLIYPDREDLPVQQELRALSLEHSEADEDAPGVLDAYMEARTVMDAHPGADDALERLRRRERLSPYSSTWPSREKWERRKRAHRLFARRES